MGDMAVKGHLCANAREFLAALELHDLVRLRQSCELALAVIPFHDRTLDPRVLFFPALFGYATPEERAAYLGDHVFTRAIVERWQQAPDTCGSALRRLSDEARLKLNDAVETLDEVRHLAGLPEPVAA